MSKEQCCISKAGIVFLLATWVLLVSGVATLAQNPILDATFDRESLTIPLEGSATAWLAIENASVQEADAIEIMRLSGSVVLSPVPPVEVLDAFSETRLPIVLSADEGAVLGAEEAVFELSYTYCVGDLCFQIIEELTLGIEFVPAVTGQFDAPMDDPVVLPDDGAGQSSLVLPISLGLLLAATLIAGKAWGRRWWIVLLLVAVLGVGLGYGILKGQDQQAQSIGAVLCTSCVGIEETPHEEPNLSEEARQQIAAITDPIDLLLFTATWCHACPFAKAMVQQATDINSLISVQWIDVDESKDAAREYGIVQSGRTIVPAILRLDTQETIFGIENLEVRLLALLEEAP